MKKKRHYRWKWLIFFLLAIVAYAILSSPMFAIGKVVVEGNRTLTVPEICRLAEIQAPVNIFTVDTGAIKNRLEHDLRIEKVSVRRIFPAELLIKVQERQPMAVIKADYGYVDISENGYILHAYNSLPNAKYPMITGIIVNDKYIGDKLSTPALDKVMQFFSDLSASSLARISEINIANPAAIMAYTNDGIQIKLGNIASPLEAARQTNEFFHDILKIKKPIQYVDFSCPFPVFKFK